MSLHLLWPFQLESSSSRAVSHSERQQQQQQQQHFILHRTDYSFIKYRCKIDKKEYMYRKSDSGGKIIVMCKEAN